jgi:hypothetical protein
VAGIETVGATAEQQTRAVLTEAQLAELAATGHTRLRAVVDRATAAAMEDAVWSHLARRGIRRDDRQTWPAGTPPKLQALRRARAFEGFDNDAVSGAADDLLHAGRWIAAGPWGPALVTFPRPGPWVLPHQVWHFDLPGRGDPDRHHALRLFGFVADVAPMGGGTLVVEGSHELVRRMVRAAPDHDAGPSATIKRRLVRQHPWFRALCREGSGRVAQLMVDGDEIDGVRVRVVELTGAAGDLVVVLPWTLHNAAPNTSETPRIMVTNTYLRDDNPFYAPQATGSDTTP